MAALVCDECSINFPNEPGHLKCAGCGNPTRLYGSVLADADWKKNALLFKSEPLPKSAEDLRIVNWRRGYMRRIGYEYSTSCMVARSQGVDVHFIEALIARGASHKDALRIAC